VPVVAAGWDPSPTDGVVAMERVRWSLGQAGLRGAAAVIAFADQPLPAAKGIHFVTLPPSVGPAFRPVPSPDDQAVRSRLGLPETYVLCLAPPEDRLDLLLAAWTWVDGSVGESVPLVVAGLPSSASELLLSRAKEMDVAGSARILGESELSNLAPLFRGAQAYLDAGGSSAQVLRWAMACGLPVAAMESVQSTAVLGDAAYLAAAEDSRALGAACLTLLVEPDVAGPLRQKGLVRAAAFHGDGPLQACYELFGQIARPIRTGERQRGGP
ncbi:MAG: glycosyltransferase, partial [Anaerolineales bacterium]